MREATALEIIITVSLTYKQFGVVVRDKHVIVVLAQILAPIALIITTFFMVISSQQHYFIRMKIVN